MFLNVTVCRFAFAKAEGLLKPVTNCCLPLLKRTIRAQKFFLPSFFNQTRMRIVFFCLFAAALASCGNGKADDAAVFVKGKTLVPLPVSPDKLKGTYTGDFKGSPISITLSYVNDNRASGYNVHKGLTRNISGPVEATPQGLHFTLAEPGNNPFDGTFDFVIDTATWTAKGKWVPKEKGEETSFTAKKQAPVKEDELYGMTFFDTLQNYITLKPDGSCTYSYFPDTTNTGQLLTVRGNYLKEKGKVTVFWQKNEVFPSGKSSFKWMEKKPYPDDEYIERSLKGEGRVFTQIYD